MCSDTSRTERTICAFPGCTKPVWQDPDGSFSSFCGRTHMEGVTKMSDGTLRCKSCLVKPVYVENGRKHDFCGMRCATAYRNGQRHPPMLTNTTQVVACGITGCRKPAFKDRFGNVGQFCSNDHRLKAVQDGVAEACLNCAVWPKNFVNAKMSDFCSRDCAINKLDEAPVILAVPSTHCDYTGAAQQFADQWKHTPSIPNIVKIWKVFSSREHNDRFSRYKLAVERRTGLDGGNSRRRWHGTVRGCRLGDSQSSFTFCGDPLCSLCSILQSSFELAKAGQRTNFGRFGAGIYTSATSSKANDYIWERGGSPYRAMLLNEVVMGKVKKLTQDSPNLTEPPAGFDAVVGEPGNVLNYDESIVYKNDAIRPLFLIIFKV